MYKVIKTGSEGNAVIYQDNILVDCGVPFSLIKPYLPGLQIVLLSHIHSDHFNLSTLKKILFERPSVRIGCGHWMVKHLEGLKNVDVYEIGRLYDYGHFAISPVKLYHDVENFGYRIFQREQSVFHATDTAHLEGITAKNYDLLAIEHNYNEETIDQVIAEIESKGQYAHQRNSFKSHLSEQQASDFIYKNRGPDTKILRLHQSKL